MFSCICHASALRGEIFFLVWDTFASGFLVLEGQGGGVRLFLRVIDRLIGGGGRGGNFRRRLIGKEIRNSSNGLGTIPRLFVILLLRIIVVVVIVFHERILHIRGNLLHRNERFVTAYFIRKWVSLVSDRSSYLLYYYLSNHILLESSMLFFRMVMD